MRAVAHEITRGVGVRGQDDAVGARVAVEGVADDVGGEPVGVARGLGAYGGGPRTPIERWYSRVAEVAFANARSSGSVTLARFLLVYACGCGWVRPSTSATHIGAGNERVGGATFKLVPVSTRKLALRRVQHVPARACTQRTHPSRGARGDCGDGRARDLDAREPPCHIHRGGARRVAAGECGRSFFVVGHVALDAAGCVADGRERDAVGARVAGGVPDDACRKRVGQARVL